MAWEKKKKGRYTGLKSNDTDNMVNGPPSMITIVGIDCVLMRKTAECGGCITLERQHYL